MDAVGYIWAISMLWASASLLTALTLVVRRAVLDRRDQARAAPRQEVTQLLLQHLEGAMPLDWLVNGMDPGYFDLVDEVASELLNMMQGSGRLKLVEALRALGTVERKIRKLRRGSPRERVAAATILSCFDEPQVVAALESQLFHRDSSVKLAAAVALAELGAITSVQALIDRLRLGAGANSRVLFIVFRKLLPESALQLVELLHSDAPIFVKALALDAFGHSGDFTTLETLTLFAGDDSIELRIQALKALAQLGHPGAQPAVERALRDAAWEVRVQGAVCAARIGLAETLPRLVELLSDSAWWVRFRAAEALYALGPPGIAILAKRGGSQTAPDDLARCVLAERTMA